MKEIEERTETRVTFGFCMQDVFECSLDISNANQPPIIARY